MAARVDRIATKVGDHFQKGDVLVEFDCAVPRAQEQRAHAVLTQAEKTYTIDQRLVALKSMGQLELDVAAAEVEKAKADVAAAVAVTSKCTITAPFSGITVEQFQSDVNQWLKTAKHQRWNRPYTELVYQPMLEVLNLFRANGYKTYIVTGGGQDFVRVYASQVYGVPPEQVVGSSGAVKFQTAPDNKPELVKQPQIDFIDDGPGKPVGINRFIGRRPILAFGNSDGDQQMLEYTAGGPGARFMGLVHHTDAVREFAYDRQSHIGKLDKALDEAMQRKWVVVDMKTDWKAIFPFEKK